jgi:hypothetical protein
MGLGKAGHRRLVWEIVRSTARVFAEGKAFVALGRHLGFGAPERDSGQV